MHRSLSSVHFKQNGPRCDGGLLRSSCSSSCPTPSKSINPCIWSAVTPVVLLTLLIPPPHYAFLSLQPTNWLVEMPLSKKPRKNANPIFFPSVFTSTKRSPQQILPKAKPRNYNLHPAVPWLWGTRLWKKLWATFEQLTWQHKRMGHRIKLSGTLPIQNKLYIRCARKSLVPCFSKGLILWFWTWVSLAHEQI